MMMHFSRKIYQQQHMPDTKPFALHQCMKCRWL